MHLAESAAIGPVRACSAWPLPPPGRAPWWRAISSGELVAYRYENGRELWSDALARTSISTQVGALTDVDADPIIDRRPGLCAGAGRAHGGL